MAVVVAVGIYVLLMLIGICFGNIPDEWEK